MKMNKLSPENIEKIAVGCVETYVSRCSRLVACFTSSDKNPIWDGCINIYKNSNHSNANLIGKVYVQIKGTTTSSKIEQIKYDVRVDDLKKYMNNGGIVYFVVAIYDNEECIFYKILLPTDIQDLIRGKEQQQTISIEYSRIPKNNMEFENEINFFYANSQKQYSSGGKSIKFEMAWEKGIREFMAYTRNDNMQDMLLSITKEPLRLYGKFENQHIVIADKFKLMFVQDCKCEVKVGDVVFFNNVQINHFNGDYVLGIGNGMKLTIKDPECESPKNLFSYDCKSKMLKDIIKEYEFLLALHRCKILKIQDFELNFKNIISDEVAQDFSEKLALCYRLQKLWKKLQMCVDFDFSKLTEGDNDNIHILYSALIEDKTIPLVIKQEKFISKVKIGGYEIAIVGYPIEGTNEFRIKDFFQSEEFVTYEDNGEKRNTSLFSLFRKDDYLSCMNVPYEKIASSYEKYIIENPKIFVRATNDLLEMLKAYDCMSSNDIRKKSLLKACENLAQWLMESDRDSANQFYHKINIFQIIRRYRNLTQDEQSELMIIEEQSNDNLIKTAVNLLLADEKHFNFFFSKLSREEQTAFKAFPIYNLLEIK